MAKKGKSKGFLGKAASFLGSIPNVGDVAKKAKKAVKSTAKKAGNAVKATAKKAKTAAKSTAKKAKKAVKSTAKKAKKAASSAKKKIKKKAKKAKKKLGKVYTKARKTANNLSKSKMVKQVKKAAKKAVLTTKKAVKKTTAVVKKTTKKVVQDVKNKAKQALVVLKPTKKPEKAPPSDRTMGKKIEGEAELEAFFNEYLKNPRPTDDKITYEGMRKVVGSNGSGTIDGLAPIAMAGYELFVKDFVTLGDPKATAEEKVIAGISVLPIGKSLKATKAYNKQRIIENVNESKKARESSNFSKYLIKEKEVLENTKNSTKKVEGKEQDSKQLAEYVKSLDKGTGELKHPVLDNPRVGSALKDDFYHNFNDIIDNYAVDAQRFDLPNKKGHMDSLYQIEGSMVKYETKYVEVKNNAPEMLQTKETRDGVFEWVVDPTTNTVTHRTFIPGGKVSGKINQWGK